MDTTRVLIAIILSLALVVAYQELVLKRFAPPTPEKTAAGTPKAPPSAAATAALTAAAPTAATPPPTEAASERIIEVSTDLYTAEFTTRGARLKSLKLKRYTETAARNSPPYEMIRPSPQGHLPLGVVFMHGSETLSDNALVYSTDAPAEIHLDGKGQATLVFSAAAADGAKIEKSFALSGGSYVFAMSVSMAGGAPTSALGLGMSSSLQASTGFRNVPELQADVNNKVLTESESALRKGVAPVEGAVTYAGFGDQYFLAAFLPEAPRAGMLQMVYTGSEAIANLLFPGATQITSRVYMGPKLLEALEAADPALNKALNFGWTGPLALAFLRLLKLFHRIAPNYGVDIILLTLLVRILLLPMSIRSQRSMMKMQRLQPQMERLREKFKDDQERLQREMVDLYRRNRVNPLGGCAPMALQFPIFIALYYALEYAVELRHAPFIAWIKDLSAPDCLEIPGMPALPYIQCHGLPVLVLLMGLSTFVQQWMSPTTPDPNQQRMMMLTPIVFTIMLVNFPAGLSLYYFASNVLGIIQQFVLNREFKQYTPA